jgi:hypothetical protein
MHPPGVWVEAELARRRRSDEVWKRVAHKEEAEVPPAGSCSPPLPALPLRGDGDNTDGPPVTCGISTEAATFEVAALIVA